ncbi:MAG: hypothetical protein MUF71_17140 [Candidatus Kapabacteria bacterium]|nr:hypothetical protein [Candidatus Kapabacteria bacterium]
MDSPSVHTIPNNADGSSTNQTVSTFQTLSTTSQERTGQPQKMLKLRVSGSQRVVCLTRWGFGTAGSSEQ